MNRFFITNKSFVSITAVVIILVSGFMNYTLASTPANNKQLGFLRSITEQTLVLWGTVKAWEGWKKGGEFIRDGLNTIKEFSANTYTTIVEHLESPFISRSQREYPKRNPSDVPQDTFIPYEEPNYRGRVSFNTDREVALVQNIMREHGAMFSDNEIKEMMAQARIQGSNIPRNALPDVVYRTSPGNDFVTSNHVSPSHSTASQIRGQHYEIQTWTAGRRSVPVGDTFAIEVYWRAILWGPDGVPILVEEPNKEIVYIDGRYHPVAKCVNVYVGDIPIPSRYGTTRAYFQHEYESYSGQPARYTGDIRNNGCRVESPFGSDFVIDISAAEFELFVRVIQAEAKGEGYEGMLAVASSIVARAKASNTNGFRNKDTLADIIYQPNQYQPVGDGLFMNRSNDPYPINDNNQRVAELARRAALEALHGNPGPIPLRNGTEPAMYFYNPDIAKSKCLHRTLDFAMKLGDHAFFYHNDKSRSEREAECQYMQMHNYRGEVIPEHRRHQCDVAERRAKGERDPMYNPNYTIWCNMETYGI